MSAKLFGKHRGLVTNNRDPMMCGRIQAKVPNLINYADTTWALPCVPYAGKNVGWLTMPPLNAQVVSGKPTLQHASPWVVSGCSSSTPCITEGAF